MTTINAATARPSSVATSRLVWAPRQNPQWSGQWWPSNWKFEGQRVWHRLEDGKQCNLHRIGRQGRLYFYSMNRDYVPNLFSVE